MIDDLKNVLVEVQAYRETMHEGTTSVLVDNWIAVTKQLIVELEVLGYEN